MTTPPQPAPAPPELQRTLCLLFRAGGERVAIRAADVQKVSPLGQLSRLPRLPAAVLGITQHRGRIVTVLDAATILLDSLTAASAPDARLLILERPVRHLGLLVDAVEEIEAVRMPADLSTLHRGQHPALAVAQHRGRAVPIVDVEALVQVVGAMPMRLG